MMASSPCQAQYAMEVEENDKRPQNLGDQDSDRSSTKWASKSKFSPYKEGSVTSMTKADDEIIFICSEGNTIMMSVKNNLERQKLPVDVGVKDFSVSRSGTIWMLNTGRNDHTVREVQKTRISNKFTTGGLPMCICMTSKNNVVIGHDRQMVMYTERGKIVSKSSGGSSSPVWCPIRIAECPVTKNLAVADDSNIGLAVLNDKLQRLYSYHGEKIEDSPGGQLFRASDVSYTDTGLLVVSDYNNRSVSLLGGEGQFLQTLYTHSARPLAVCVKSIRCVYVAFDDKSVHVVRDLEKY